MDEEKLVSSLKEAFVPMFERIETRCNNLEAEIKDINSRLINVEKQFNDLIDIARNLRKIN